MKVIATLEVLPIASLTLQYSLEAIFCMGVDVLYLPYIAFLLIFTIRFTEQYNVIICNRQYTVSEFFTDKISADFASVPGFANLNTSKEVIITNLYSGYLRDG